MAIQILWDKGFHLGGKRLKFFHENLSIECTEREYQQVQEFKRSNVYSFIEKIFTYMLVHEVR